MTDFIWIKDNVVEPIKCKTLIERFEHFENCGMTISRQDISESTKLEMDDKALSYTWGHGFGFEDPTGMIISLEIMQSFMEYSEEYASLANMDLSVKQFKVQKTDPGKGYHSWHHESSCHLTCQRVAVFTLYLNDIDEGGETEFLYQRKRVSPKEGRMVWWPAGFTHLHRGNPPLGDDAKYIVTGWIEIQ